MTDPTADQAIQDAIAQYSKCMAIHLDPIGHPDEHKRELHGAYAGHYAAIVVLLHELRESNPTAADRVAAWMAKQDAETINDWIHELEARHG